MAERAKAGRNTEQKTAWALEIARVVELKDILLVRSQSATNKLDLTAKANGAVNLTAKVVHPPQADDGHRRFIVEAEAVLTGTNKAQPPESLYTVSAAFALFYLVPKDLLLPDEAFAAFGELNGMLHAYPYLREVLQTTVQRMGFPRVTLPVLRAGRGKKQT